MLRRGAGKTRQKKPTRQPNWIPETIYLKDFTFPKHWKCNMHEIPKKLMKHIVSTMSSHGFWHFPAECRNNSHRIPSMSLWHVPAASLSHLPMSHRWRCSPRPANEDRRGHDTKTNTRNTPVMTYSRSLEIGVWQHILN